ncbi:MAG TPA: pyridoxine 5'-phosphate synthase, partial [Alcanivorax sp.]|nr:pyridoxine 5'-phosphate synthase [Alcanivorax sp.]
VRCRAPTIEIRTGHYADLTAPEARDQEAAARELTRIRDAVALGREAGLIVNAGHGLHYHNTREIAAIPGINELNIGHGIIARAVMTGLDEAVRAMRVLIDGAAGSAL